MRFCVEKVASVVDIKKRNRSRKKESDELGFSEVRHHVAIAMDYEPVPSGWPDFPSRFHKLVDPTGKEFFLEETENKIVKFISKHLPPQQILTYVIDMIPEEISFDMMKKHADEVFYYWHSQRGAMLEKPLAIAEKSDERLAFSRLTFDLDDIENSICPPIFEEFLSRTTNRNCFAAFIGSIFFQDSYMQQYLYVHGQGQDGKSSVMNVLRSIIGQGYQSINPKVSGDRFWYMKTYGKRLCVASDLNQYEANKFPSSAEIKALTGGDPIFYEGKGEGGFTENSISKIILISNFPPTISGQKSDVRRLIYCQVEKTDNNDFGDIEKYVDRLKKESKQIIEYCISVYKKMCPKHGPISVDKPEDLIDAAEEYYTMLFENNFKVVNGAELSFGTVRERLLSLGIKDNREVHNIKACWERRYNIVPKKKNGFRFYENLKIISYGVIQDQTTRP